MHPQPCTLHQGAAKAERAAKDDSLVKGLGEQLSGMRAHVKEQLGALTEHVAAVGSEVETVHPSTLHLTCNPEA